MVVLCILYPSTIDVAGYPPLLDPAESLAGRAGVDGTAATAECTIALLQAGRENTAAARPHLERGLRSLARVREPATRARMQCLLAQAQIAITDGPEDRALPLARQAV